MEKKTTTFHGKDMYLLGKDEDGYHYYLEAPSWDCGWYWGFGYIEGFSSIRATDRGHKSHQHADNFMSEFFTEWNGNKPILTERTFSEAEGWELSELFAQFYHLKEQAEFWGEGKMNVASTKIDSWENKDLASKINQKMIPVITKRIIEILTTEQEGNGND